MGELLQRMTDEGRGKRCPSCLEFVADDSEPCVICRVDASLDRYYTALKQIIKDPENARQIASEALWANRRAR